MPPIPNSKPTVTFKTSQKNIDQPGNKGSLFLMKEGAKAASTMNRIPVLQKHLSLPTEEYHLGKGILSLRII